MKILFSLYWHVLAFVLIALGVCLGLDAAFRLLNSDSTKLVILGACMVPTVLGLAALLVLVTFYHRPVPISAEEEKIV